MARFVPAPGLPRAVSLTALLAACVHAGGPRAPSAFAIRDVAVMDGRERIERATVVVDAGRISAVGPDAPIPDGARIVDCEGCTLLPGLIDAHAHAMSPDPGPLQESLRFGVTTVLDMMTAPEFATALRAATSRPDVADFRSAGNPVTAPGGHGTQFGIPYETLARPEEAQAFVDRRVAEGSDYIKIVADDLAAMGWPTPMPTLDAPTLKAAVDAAHADGRLAIVHVSQQEDARTAIEAGADGLAHVFSDQPADDALVALAAEKGVFVIATMPIVDSLTGTGGAALADDPWIGPRLDPRLMDHLRGDAATAYGLAEHSTLSADAAATSIARLHAAGVPILAGTDAPNVGIVYGASLHQELARLVDAGLTPTDALVAATSATASAFHLDDRGVIAPGMRADLLLVQGDPTADVTATRHIVGVWKAGVRASLK